MTNLISDHNRFLRGAQVVLGVAAATMMTVGAAFASSPGRMVAQPQAPNAQQQKQRPVMRPAAFIPVQLAAGIAEAPMGLTSNGHLPLGSVDDAEGASSFYAAMKVFDAVENVADGLGPVYNAQSCRECHQAPMSGGASQMTVLRAGGYVDGQFVAHAGGSLIQDRAIDPSLQEFVDAHSDDVTAQRLSLSILGDGFVEAVPDQTFFDIAAAQPESMRGEVVMVDVLEAPGVQRVGRFGWKSQHASLLSFAADAYLNEMGITSPLFPQENSSDGNSVAAFDSVADPEDEAQSASPFGIDVHIFADYSRSLAAPPRIISALSRSDVNTGQALFEQVGCAMCHTSELVTAPAGTLLNGGTFTVSHALGDKRIHPYSDYLLHDIGIGDGIHQTGSPEARNKMRTAPLWGLSMRNRYMHDGQSYTLEEAIRRHAGQAEQVRRRFEDLSRPERRQMLLFLRSL